MFNKQTHTQCMLNTVGHDKSNQIKSVSHHDSHARSCGGPEVQFDIAVVANQTSLFYFIRKIALFNIRVQKKKISVCIENSSPSTHLFVARSVVLTRKSVALEAGQETWRRREGVGRPGAPPRQVRL